MNYFLRLAGYAPQFIRPVIVNGTALGIDESDAGHYLW